VYALWVGAVTLAAHQWLVFDIPTPPTANNLYRNVPGKGRVKTGVYGDWQIDAGWRVLQQLPKPVPHCAGEVHIDIDMPPGADLDGLKAICDLLQMPQRTRLKRSLGIITDDKLIVDYHVRRVSKDSPCIVRIRPVGEWGT
jgi:Holliday junction resolvase RusA-like endonuclease